MNKEMERQILKMSKKLKDMETLIERTNYSDTNLRYFGEYYIDNAIQTASEVMGD